MEQFMWKRSDQRLAEFLLAESAPEGSHTPKPTHKTIAKHLAAAREVITRMHV